MHRITIAVSGVLLLAACQQPAPADNAAPVENEAPLPENTVAVPADEALPEPPAPEPDTATPEPAATPSASPTPSPSPSASPTPAETAAFPPRFRGRWGLTVADCDPARADNKGLMRIAPTIIRFYESRGTPETIVRRTPGTIVATLAMNGEGQTWTDTTRFTLGNQGRTLLRVRDQGGPPLRYTKCG